MTLAELDRLVRRTPARHPTVVVGATIDGERRTWHRGELPRAARSVFEIGSVTKTVTALLLAERVLAGEMAYDDPVASYLPVGPPEVGRPITLEDLATHHSGLPRLAHGTVVTGLTTERSDPYARFDEATLIRAVSRTRPRRPPGRRFGYSNLGVGLLGWALARQAGTSYAELVADRVAGPLGLGATTVGGTGDPADPALVPGRSAWGRPAGPWDLALLAGAGGVRSTVGDLLRYLDLFTAAAEAQGSALGRAAADTRRVRHGLSRHPRPDDGGVGIGLGWLVLPDESLVHDGGTGGHRAFVACHPPSGAALVVLSARSRSVTPLGLRLWRAVRPPTPRRT